MTTFIDFRSHKEWNAKEFVSLVSPFKSENPVIAFDVDLTLIGENLSDSPVHPARVGAAETIRALHEDGWKVILWSAGNNADAVVAQFGIRDIIAGTFRKLDHFPVKASEVMDHLGLVPDVTVDDDTAEHIEGRAFIHASSFWGEEVEELLRSQISVGDEPLADWEIELLLG